MPTLKQIIFASLLVLALLTTAAAQNSTSVTAQSSSLTITATAAGDRVRITAPSSVVQMRLEVYAASGEKLFDQEIRGGNVFDWHLQDGQAQRLAPGTYVCVVTAKSVSGKLTQKIGSVSVAEKSVSVQATGSPQLSVQQTQAIGPVEENSSWTIPSKDEPQTPTVIAHDGTDGQMIRGRGALTFRIGNFFSGIDQEQMRLTETGNLGIGTDKPAATLDVAGTIRAERFLIAKPKLTGVDKTTANSLTVEATDSVQTLIAGTGTQDRIAKWTDNAGTLGDSGITESAGNIGIGTPTPTQALEVANGRIIVTGSQTLAAPGGLLEIGTTLTNNHNQASGIRMRNTFNGNADSQAALDVAPTFAPSASISLARGFISTAFFAPPAGVTITDGYGGNANTAYSNTGGAVTNGAGFAIRSPIVFGALKPTTQYGLRINNQGIGGTTNSYGLFVDAQSGSTNNYSAIFAGGNVGIGTSAPNTKLDVAGNINTSTQYNIGGLGVLSRSADNIFAGVDAGASNNIGLGNSFFGTSAGLSNTDGFQNSFFGLSAGSNNTFGARNSFFGYFAGLSNTTEGDNTFVGSLSNGATGITNATAFGYRAKVTQSNSLVLGGINTVNGATADTNVGIGTTSPSFKLHLVDPSNTGLRVQTNGSGGTVASFGGNGDFQIDAPNIVGGRFIVKEDGKVGIGTATPGGRLEVKGDSSTVPFTVMRSTGGFALAAFDDGNVAIGTLETPSTTTHACYNFIFGGNYFAGCSSAAEYVPSIDSGAGFPETADLVSIAPAVTNPYGDTHGPFTVQKAAKPCDDNLLGFITNPASGADGKKLNDHYLPLAIYGYFPAKVTVENGAIRRGDALTSSSKAGYGMKATQACKIVGYALEDANKEGTIQVFAHHGENAAPAVAALQAQVRQLQREKSKQMAALQTQSAKLQARLKALEQAVQRSTENSSLLTRRRSASRGAVPKSTPTASRRLIHRRAINRSRTVSNGF